MMKAGFHSNPEELGGHTPPVVGACVHIEVAAVAHGRSHGTEEMGIPVHTLVGFDMADGVVAAVGGRSADMAVAAAVADNALMVVEEGGADHHPTSADRDSCIVGGVHFVGADPALEVEVEVVRLGAGCGPADCRCLVHKAEEEVAWVPESLGDCIGVEEGAEVLEGLEWVQKVQLGQRAWGNVHAQVEVEVLVGQAGFHSFLPERRGAASGVLLHQV